MQVDMTQEEHVKIDFYYSTQGYQEKNNILAKDNGKFKANRLKAPFFKNDLLAFPGKVPKTLGD